MPTDASDFPELTAARGGVVLDLHVQPGARRTEVVGRHGDACKVKVSAPPSDGKANAAVVELMAATFGRPKRDVAVVAGTTSRRKRVAIAGISVADAAKTLAILYGRGG